MGFETGEVIVTQKDAPTVSAGEFAGLLGLLNPFVALQVVWVQEDNLMMRAVLEQVDSAALGAAHEVEMLTAWEEVRVLGRVGPTGPAAEFSEVQILEEHIVVGRLAFDRLCFLSPGRWLCQPEKHFPSQLPVDFGKPNACGLADSR
jgi:hypothetical protein